MHTHNEIKRGKTKYKMHNVTILDRRFAELLGYWILFEIDFK